MPPSGNEKCNKPRCLVCKHIDTAPNIVHNATGTVLKPGKFNCDSDNVVYMLNCTLCPLATYIGETSTSFRLRFNNHKHSIRRNSTGFPVAEHFNLPNHSLSHLKCSILFGNFRTAQERRKREIKTILQLKAHTTGLNRDLSFMSTHARIAPDVYSL